jgi:hypothetical protein
LVPRSRWVEQVLERALGEQPGSTLPREVYESPALEAQLRESPQTPQLGKPIPAEAFAGLRKASEFKQASKPPANESAVQRNIRLAEERRQKK